MTTNSTISAVVPTLNEAANLEYLLPTIAWCDEVIVVDQGSIDGTPEVAVAHGAQVLSVEWQPAFDACRKLGSSKASGQWIFQLDADEMVPAALAERLRELAQRTDIDIVAIPRLNYFQGPMPAGGLWPDVQYRFFRRDSVELTAEVHRYLKLRSSRIFHVPPSSQEALHHFHYNSASHFVGKLDRYTDLEIEGEWAAVGQPGARAFLWEPLRVFLSRYVKQSAFRYGWRGLWLSVFWTFYTYVRAVKAWEKHNLPGIKESEKERRNEILNQFTS